MCFVLLRRQNKTKSCKVSGQGWDLNLMCICPIKWWICCDTLRVWRKLDALWKSAAAQNSWQGCKFLNGTSSVDCEQCCELWCRGCVRDLCVMASDGIFLLCLVPPERLYQTTVVMWFFDRPTNHLPLAQMACGAHQKRRVQKELPNTCCLCSKHFSWVEI